MKDQGKRDKEKKNLNNAFLSVWSLTCCSQECIHCIVPLPHHLLPQQWAALCQISGWLIGRGSTERNDGSAVNLWAKWLQNVSINWFHRVPLSLCTLLAHKLLWNCVNTTKIKKTKHLIRSIFLCTLISRGKTPGVPHLPLFRYFKLYSCYLFLKHKSLCLYISKADRKPWSTIARFQFIPWGITVSALHLHR